MSVRLRRKKYGQVIADRLEVLRFEKSKNDCLEEALLEAQRALAEEPRILTKCKMQQEYIAVQVWTAERMHCSECQATVVGVPTDWRFCPVCNSQVTEFTREDSPYDRQATNAVRDAMKVFDIGAGELIR